MITLIFLIFGMLLSFSYAVQFSLLFRDSDRFLKGTDTKDSDLHEVHVETRREHLKYALIFGYFFFVLFLVTVSLWKYL